MPSTPDKYILNNYLGDGVYASFDGYQIWLITQEGMRIALEPAVMARLHTYEKTVREHLLKGKTEEVK